jgi:hypothetical protein
MSSPKSNPRNMRKFTDAWLDKAIVPRCVAQLTLGPNHIPFNKLRNPIRHYTPPQGIFSIFTPQGLES